MVDKLIKKLVDELQLEPKVKFGVDIKADPNTNEWVVRIIGISQQTLKQERFKTDYGAAMFVAEYVQEQLSK